MERNCFTYAAFSAAVREAGGPTDRNDLAISSGIHIKTLQGGLRDNSRMYGKNRKRAVKFLTKLGNKQPKVVEAVVTNQSSWLRELKKAIEEDVANLKRQIAECQKVLVALK